MYEGIFSPFPLQPPKKSQIPERPRLQYHHEERHLLGDLYLHHQSHLHRDHLHPLLHPTLTENIRRRLHIREEMRKRKGDDRITSRSDRITNASSSNCSYSWNRTERFTPRILIGFCSASDFSPKEYPSTGPIYGYKNSRRELEAREGPVPMEVSTTS